MEKRPEKYQPDGIEELLVTFQLYRTFDRYRKGKQWLVRRQQKRRGRGRGNHVKDGL